MNTFHWDPIRDLIMALNAVDIVLLSSFGLHICIPHMGLIVSEKVISDLHKILAFSGSKVKIIVTDTSHLFTETHKILSVMEENTLDLPGRLHWKCANTWRRCHCLLDYYADVCLVSMILVLVPDYVIWTCYANPHSFYWNVKVLTSDLARDVLWIDMDVSTVISTLLSCLWVCIQLTFIESTQQLYAEESRGSSKPNTRKGRPLNQGIPTCPGGIVRTWE